MISSKRFLHTATAQRLPEWLKIDIAKYKNIYKLFPQIGLENDQDQNIIKYKDPYLGNIDLNIVFSSDRIAGLWDIATMSMRGVMSCMHWENHHHSHLLGQMLDPFIGVIYLTDNTKTPYGRSMIKRSVVRIIYDELEKKFSIFVEKPYARTENTKPYVYDNKCPDHSEITDYFIKYLIEKTNNKIEIFSYKSNFKKIKNCNMPAAYPREFLISAYQAYSDYGLNITSKYLDEEEVKNLKLIS